MFKVHRTVIIITPVLNFQDFDLKCQKVMTRIGFGD